MTADPRPDDAPPLTGESESLLLVLCDPSVAPNASPSYPRSLRRRLAAIERAARADAEARLGEVLELLVYSDVPQRIVDRAHDIAALAPRGGAR